MSSERFAGPAGPGAQSTASVGVLGPTISRAFHWGAARGSKGPVSAAPHVRAETETRANELKEGPPMGVA
jgi:hypothetical protein